MVLALSGIKVIDVSQVAAVPMAARHLGDFGADVIHVENPITGDSWRYYQAGQGPGNNGVPSKINYNWENYNRNKRSLSIDLTHPSGQEIIHRLVEKADVFVTNLRQFEMEKFKLGYNVLNRINPKIIYGSLSGYGKKGPDKDIPAYDITAFWARSGMCDMLTQPSLPNPGYRTAIGDNVAGLALAYGIMTALFHRERTGVGQEIDVSLLHAGMYQISYDVAGALVTDLDFRDWRDEPPGELSKRAFEANVPVTYFLRSKLMNPLAAGYYTKDNILLILMMLRPDPYWGRFCKAIGKPELANDSRFTLFNARAENRNLLISILDQLFSTKTAAEWEPLLRDIPHAPVRTIKQAINDPQAEANNFFVKYTHPEYGQIRMLANPVNLSKTPANVRRPAPAVGEHTVEILRENGFAYEQIEKLKELKIIK